MVLRVRVVAQRIHEAEQVRVERDAAALNKESVRIVAAAPCGDFLPLHAVRKCGAVRYELVQLFVERAVDEETLLEAGVKEVDVVLPHIVHRLNVRVRQLLHHLVPARLEDLV